MSYVIVIAGIPIASVNMWNIMFRDNILSSVRTTSLSSAFIIAQYGDGDFPKQLAGQEYR